MMSLERKQVKEVLDEDVLAWRRVLDREREQIKVFDEVIKPKTESDLSTEVAFEKEVEKLQVMLERRIASVEVINRARGAAALVPGVAGPGRQAEAEKEAFLSAPVVATWNGITRYLTDPSVTQRTRDSMKTKLAELQASINTLVFGFNNIITALSGPGITNEQLSRVLPRVLSTQAVYVLIQKQLFTNQLSMIRSGDIEAQMADLVAGLPRGAGVIGDRVDAILASPLLSPFWLRAGDDAAVRRARILAAETGNPLSADEFQRVRSSIFGAKSSRIPLDPALDAELNRMAAVETAAKEEIGRLETKLPEPYRPPPTYSMLSPEFVQGAVKTAEEWRDASLAADTTRLQAVLNKYKPLPGGVWNDNAALGGDAVVENDARELGDDLVELRERLAELKGEDVSRASIQAVVTPLVDGLVNNARNSNARRKDYLRAITALMNTYLDEKAELLDLEKDERVAQAKLIPKVGRAKPRFGQLGLWYDDMRNDPYLVRS
jgi:hypothetical protein